MDCRSLLDLSDLHIINMKKNVIKTSSKLKLNETSMIVSLFFVSSFSNVYAELPIAHAFIPWSNNVQVISRTNNALHIGQKDNLSGNWLLNWQSFNISEGSRVQFHQPGKNHIALNRIFQNDASKILGTIDANGSIYLINTNGFLFGKNSKINVNSLVASTLSLNMSNEDFINGDKNIANLVNDGKSAFIGTPLMGDINIEEGAEITTSDGGNILMFAPDIFNEGNLTTTSGQTILAATKDKVYLTPSTDPALRGFLVEVKTGGSVENLGHILSNKGNITLAGMAINQKGTLKATSAVNENGSIRLLARDGAGGREFDDDNAIATNLINANDELILGIDIDKAKDPQGGFLRNDRYFVAKRTGEVILHEGSRIIIDVDKSDKTQVTDVQSIEKPSIEITGKTIRLKTDSAIVAAGANVLLHATTNAQSTAISLQGDLRENDGESTIIMESGSRIDVAGTTSTEVDMSRNQLDVTLTANFLRDAPLQRTGPLRQGEIKTVSLDLREGSALGDISDLVAASVKRDINERLSEGGEVKVLSQGSVQLKNKSEINIAGGQINYKEGYITSSQLTDLNGNKTNIEDADPNIIYTDIFGNVSVTSQRWGKNATRTWRLFSGETSGISRFNAAYTEARDAGRLTIQTHAALLDETLIAGTKNGLLQRLTSQRANGGDYQIILSDPALVSTKSGQSVSVVDSRLLTQNESADENDILLNGFVESEGVTVESLLQIDKNTLEASGISGFNVMTNGEINIESNIKLSDGGDLSLKAKKLNIQGDITIASGNVSFISFSDLTIDYRIDVSGTWVNDNPYLKDKDLNSAINLDGGSIDLRSNNGHLLLGNADLRVNGGAWLKSNDALSVGDAGKITLSVNDVQGKNANIVLGNMQAYATGRGGKLKIITSIIDIANSFKTPSVSAGLQLSADFFQQNGFSDYTLISNTDNLTVQGNTVIAPLTTSLQFNNDITSPAESTINLIPNSDSIIGFTDKVLLPDILAQSTNITLGTNRSGAQSTGDGLRLSKGSVIKTNAGADVALFATRNVFINGEIKTQGGDVSIDLNDSNIGLSGYVANAGIWFGGDSKISTQGTFINDTANDLQRITGTLLDSGDVYVNANRGYIISESGSSIDVSGVDHEIDLPSNTVGNTVIEYQRKRVAGDAGNINLTAAEGMLLSGSLSSHAANVEGAAGGLLSVTLDTATRTSEDDTTTLTAREIHIADSNSLFPIDFLSGSQTQGSEISEDNIGQAWLSRETIQQGGFDRLRLQANKVNVVNGAAGEVVFDQSINLEMKQSLEILAPVLRVDNHQNNIESLVTLAAPYVLLGSHNIGQSSNSVIATSGPSQFNIQAGIQGNDGLLEVSGELYFQGVNAVKLNSVGDIRFRGNLELPSSTELIGSLNVTGDLNFNANQLYATTLSQFTINVTDSSESDFNNELTIQGGSSSSSILSAGSRLSFTAPVIKHSGVVKAPLGEIEFNASRQLVVSDDSLTSVSAEGLLIPFGSTLGENRWVYPFSSTNSQLFDDISASPEKIITFNSPDLQISNTATVDISGGGDLFSWEFVPGIGGSVDNLLAENAQGAFAILPDVIAGSGTYAPFDYQYYSDVSENIIGRQIDIANNDTLEAGVYTILPARYALLPGAYLLTPTGNTLLPTQNINRQDGTQVIAGKQLITGSGLHENLWSAYVIENGRDVRSGSEYIESTANQFFRDSAQNNDEFLRETPADAGNVNFIGGFNLTLPGILKGSAAEFIYEINGQRFIGSGRGAQANIAAEELRVVKQFDNIEGSQLLDASLNALGVESLLLGGTRQRTEQGLDISVVANRISIEKNASLNQQELILVSKDQINFDDASRIKIAGESGITDQQINVDGDGALVRASSQSQVIINRTNESSSPDKGIVNISKGAMIDVTSSLALDGSTDVVMDGELLLNRGSLNLSAAKILIGDIPENTNGTRLTTQNINDLNAGELLLTSRSSVDLYGDLNLQLNNLQINANSLIGFQKSNQQVKIQAKSIVLNNLNSPTSIIDNTVENNSIEFGDLLLSAGDIKIKQGEFNISNFNDVELRAENTINFSGDGLLLVDIKGDLILDTAILSAHSGAMHGVNVADSDITIKNTFKSDYDRALSLGASLQFSAKNINHQGVIDLASGTLDFNAKNNLILSDNSMIDLSGIALDFAGEKSYTTGGELNVNSSLDNITMNESATIDVSGGADSNERVFGSSGKINAVAIKGNVELNGLLRAAHGDNKIAGSLFIDTLTLSDMAVLNKVLNDNNFTQQRYIRLRKNDISLNESDSIISEHVTLLADEGSINISGRIQANGSNANANKGGQVLLAAGLNVNILSTAKIQAQATNETAVGGKLTIQSRDGFINLVEGSVINLSAGEQNHDFDGQLYLRSKRASFIDKTNRNIIASDLQGISRLDIEAYQSYDIENGQVTSTRINQSINDAKDFINLNVLNDYNLLPNENVHFHAGIEMFSVSDLTLNESLDLLESRFTDSLLGEETAVLTFRSAGNLNINQSISDGFTRESHPFDPATQLHRLAKNESWSYNFIAGADLNAAGLSQTITNNSKDKNSGNVNFSDNLIIRTGTGNIAIYAADNINIGKQTAIYTGGQSAGRGNLDLSLDLSSFGLPDTSLLDIFIAPGIEFPVNGGDLVLRAGHDIKAKQADSLLVTDWLFRIGSNHDLTENKGKLPTQVGISFAGFESGLGALGGGNIDINARGDIENISASIPSVIKYTGEAEINQTNAADPTQLDVNINTTVLERTGRGVLQVSSQANITRSQFYVDDGNIRVAALGDIGHFESDQPNNDSGIYLIAGNTRSQIKAGGDLYFQGVNNSSLLPFSEKQVNIMSLAGISGVDSFSNYYTNYTESSQLNLSSLYGDVYLRNTSSSGSNGLFSNREKGSKDVNLFSRQFSFYPGDVNIIANAGDINIDNSFTLFPTKTGNLNLLAGNNIIGNNDVSLLSISMLNVNQSDIPDINNTSRLFSSDVFVDRGDVFGEKLNHQGDQSVARIIAKSGDITATNVLNPFLFETNKQVEMIAGRDILNVSLAVTNNNRRDISLIQAGRDLKYINSSTLGKSQINHGIEINGPGELQVLAGRNINLGDQRGIVSKGNNAYSAQLDEGAGLTVMAGLGKQGADYDNFIKQFITKNSDYSDDLINYVSAGDEKIKNFESALAQFNTLDIKVKRSFIFDVFNNELTQSGIRASKEQNSQTSDNLILGYSRGLDAIAALFPSTIESVREAGLLEETTDKLIVSGGKAYTIAGMTSEFSGQLSMVASAIQLQDNKGDINIYTPGGLVNVGLSVSSKNNQVEKGIINKGNGDINLYALGDISVNQSRVQALNGGNISLWSTQGDIDAGRGAKSALTIPPPRLVTDPKSGAIIQVFDAVVQGNGIQTACFDGCDVNDSPPGNVNIHDETNLSSIQSTVFLFAPAGAIDAGDAGIRSGGDLFLATNTILNANQIDVGGDVSGSVGGGAALGADIGGLDVNSSAESTATELVAEDASAQFGAGSVAILQVEVMGLSEDEGEDNKSKNK